MRIIILAFALLVSPAMAQNAPRFHGSSESSGGSYGASRRYSGADHGATYAPPPPLWRFTYYPDMPKAGERKQGYSYYPYAPYRSGYQTDRYDRNKVQRYPVR